VLEFSVLVVFHLFIHKEGDEGELKEPRCEEKWKPFPLKKEKRPY
jgi:hypothetical protein